MYNRARKNSTRLTQLFVAYQYFSLLVSMQVCMFSRSSLDGAVNNDEREGGRAEEAPTEATVRA